MKVENMTNDSGRVIANQFIVWSDGGINYRTRTGERMRSQRGRMFQSYRTNIAFITLNGSVFLDERSWDYSRTTGKYRNLFLGESKKETEKKIKSGEYKLVNLNE